MQVSSVSMISRRFISINDLVDKIDNDALIALPGLHAFTGCDTGKHKYNLTDFHPAVYEEYDFDGSYN